MADDDDGADKGRQADEAEREEMRGPEDGVPMYNGRAVLDSPRPI